VPAAGRDRHNARDGPEHYGGPVPPIRLDQVNLVVRDVDASRAFYSRFGLDFGPEHDPVWSAHHVSAEHGDHAPIDVDLDSTTFVTQWDQGWPGGTGALLGFKVDTRTEVDALVAALVAEGVPVQQEPYDAFWGARYAVVSDPDGNGVGIMSRVDAAHRSEPPAPQ
jgi:catechol 2,3-dioxygenase-like lactoylglutathione lyase family enzyme